MDEKDRFARIEELLDAGNYLAACLYIKDEKLNADNRHDLTGMIAMRILDDLATQKNREKITFLRSLLVWLFREIPGLSFVYREQLRYSTGASSPIGDVFRGLQWLGKSFSAGTPAGENSREKMDDVKQNVDDVIEGATGKSVQDHMNDFFSNPGGNVEDGLRKAAEFFSNLGGSGRPPKDEDENE